MIALKTTLFIVLKNHNFVSQVKECLNHKWRCQGILKMKQIHLRGWRDRRGWKRYFYLGRGQEWWWAYWYRKNLKEHFIKQLICLLYSYFYVLWLSWRKFLPIMKIQIFHKHPTWKSTPTPNPQNIKTNALGAYSSIYDIYTFTEVSFFASLSTFQHHAPLMIVLRKYHSLTWEALEDILLILFAFNSWNLCFIHIGTWVPIQKLSTC